jgi:hypothetical protein
MYRRITASCVLALGLSLPLLAGEAQNDKDNPAAKKLNRDIPRHQDFLRRIEQSQGAGDVIFLGDSITHGWKARKPGRNTSASSNRSTSASAATRRVTCSGASPTAMSWTTSSPRRRSS